MIDAGGAASGLQLGYVLAFTIAALACFVSIRGVRRLEKGDTRTGLAALLLLSAGWAASHAGYLVASSPWLQHGFYLFGLVIGLAAVGPWLYFCSAYTGRKLHHDSRIRWAAILTYLLLVAVKLANPYQLYYTTEVTTVPFTHLQVAAQPLHWVVMGFAYALATIGFFMLFELFYKTDYDVGPLAALVAATALPVGLDVAGVVYPTVPELTYSPLGVAVFALGVTFVYTDRFRLLQVAGEAGDPVVILDESGTVREVNDSARELFPRLDDEDVIGRDLHRVLPDIARLVAEDDPVIERKFGNRSRYYQVSSNPFTAGRAEIGRILTFTDVTEREQYRRELERQNERLDTFASMVSHDLRNPLTIAQGNLELARDEADSEPLEIVDEALDRMDALIQDVLQLARQGQPIDDPERVDLRSQLERSWGMVDSPDAELVIADSTEILADPDRLRQLAENLFRNAIEHGGPDVTVRVGLLDEGGFYIEDDGPGIPEEHRDEVFGSGFSTNEHGTGFGLAIVEEIVDAHGWTIEATEGHDGGARFEITTGT